MPPLAETCPRFVRAAGRRPHAISVAPLENAAAAANVRCYRKAMLWFFGHAFVVAIWAATLWATVWLLAGSHHPKNSFGLAVGLGVVFDVTSIFAISPWLYFGGWGLFLYRLLRWHYDLDVIPAAIATVATAVGPWLVLTQVLVLLSPTASDIAQVAVTIAIAAAWLVVRLRRAPDSVASAHTPIGEGPSALT